MGSQLLWYPRAVQLVLQDSFMYITLIILVSPCTHRAIDGERSWL
jgi:hypothetical protein